jgi:hypothetical protein
MDYEDVMIKPVFGHKALRSWIEFDGEKYIGMGSVASYDRDGKLLDFKIEPTGLVLRYT